MGLEDPVRGDDDGRNFTFLFGDEETNFNRTKFFPVIVSPGFKETLIL
jgi:hypothetical protein